MPSRTSAHSHEGSSAWFQSLAENSPDIFYRYSVFPEQRCEYVSPSVASIVGYTPEEHYADPELKMKIVHADDLWMLERPQPRMELRWKHKNGRTVWTEQINHFIRDEDGGIVAIEGIARDITTRKELEGSLRDTERKFQTLTDIAPSSVFIYEKERFVYVNDASQELTGYTRDELYAMHFWDIVHPDHRELVRQRGKERQEGKDVPNHYEFKIIRKNGEERWVDFAARVFHMNGTVRVLGTALDITVRKRLEHERAIHEAQYRNLFESHPEPMWVYDPATLRFLAVNYAAIKKYGFSKSEFLKMTVADIRPEEDVPALMENISHDDAELSNSGAWRHRDKDGNVFSVEIASHKLTFLGTPARLVMASDVTERLLAETLLRTSEERLRDVFETAQDVIYTLSPDGYITSLNSSFERLTGWTREEWIGKPFLPMIHADDHTLALDSVAMIKANEKPPVREYRFIDKEGRLICGEVVAAPLLHDGIVQGSIGIVRDITERKKDERQLHLQSAVMEAAANAIIVTDADGCVEWVNPAFTNLTGYTFDEVHRENPRILKSGYQSPDFYENLWQTIKRGEVWHGTMLNKRKDGTFYHEVQTITPVTDSNGTIHHFIGIKFDITERIQAEHALEASERKYRSFFENSLDAILLTSPDGSIHAANPAACKMFERSEEEIIAASRKGLVDSSDPKLPELLEERARTGKAFGELTLLRRDGTPFPAEVSTALFEDGEGNQRTSMIFRDITDRKLATDMIAASERKLRTLIENSSDIIAVMDPSGKINYQSPAIERVLGYTPEELIGKNAIGFIHPEDRGIILKLIERHLSEENTTVTAEYRFLHKNGSWRIMQSIGKNLLNDPQLNGIVINSRDITEKILYEQELLRAKEQAEQADKLKDAFIANISHEIRTPLNVMFGFLELLRSGDASFPQSEIEEFHDSIRRSGHRLMRTVDEILSISLLTTGAYKSYYETIDVVGQLEALVIDLQPLAQEKNLHLELVAESHPRIDRDLYSFIQTASNLLDNAIKFTKTGGVFVRVFEEQGAVKVSIRDTGIGISENYLPSLYQAFSQEIGGYTRPYEGVGLGMALVKRYMDVNKGHIEVHSEKNKGTEFVLTFPIVIPEEKH